MTRQQEYAKAKDTAQKAETESLNQSTGGQAAKLEKKKKMVEDILRKVKDYLDLYFSYHLKTTAVVKFWRKTKKFKYFPNISIFF